MKPEGRNPRALGAPTHAIKLARTPREIGRCHAVMIELRPHLAERTAFVRQVSRQQGAGFQLAYFEVDGEVRAVAGFRIMEMLFSGRTLYVDDLVTRASDRSRGFGSQLFDWLMTHAREEGCKLLTLDSGVQRFEAHRFYLTKRMRIAAHHFTIEV